MSDMMQDKNTNETLEKEKKKMLEDRQNRQTYNRIIPTASIIPAITGTPKIQKPEDPQQRIVGSMSSIDYDLSKALADILEPLLSNTYQHSKQPQKESRT